MGSSVVIEVMRVERMWNEPDGSRRALFPRCLRKNASINLTGSVIGLLPSVHTKKHFNSDGQG
jgi:hypothetical protein